MLHLPWQMAHFSVVDITFLTVKTVFGSDDHEVKSCPAVKNVISITEKT